MIFRIKNLGILEQAEIDFRYDLILLCGHNNTGKSYLAYGIYHFLTMNKERANLRDLGNLFNKIAVQIETNLVRKNPIVINLVDIFKTYLSPHKKEIFEHVVKHYVQGLADFFAAHDQALFSTTQAQIEMSDQEIENKIRLNAFSLESAEQNRFVSISKLENSPYLNLTFEKYQTERLTESLLEDILASLFHSLFHFRTYIAPAERSAINIFSRELSLIRNKLFTQLFKSNADNMLDLLNSRVNRYPKPIGDNIEMAEDLVYLSRQKSEFGDLANELEEQILKGKIQISAAGEVNYIPNQAPTQNLAVHLTGSMVKSLSSLVFYLRHLAKKGDYLIIDEPELNLHPNNQILIARFLGRLVNEGFKVIASTHSDYIVMEMNNLIMLTKPDKQVRGLMKKYGYAENQLLKPEQVGAYVFQENGQDSQNIKVSETGLEIETIDEVVKIVNESSRDIYFTLFD
ncbi:MAG: hypothetical protein DRR16_31930 [Candidatus Parabeggiatoa sp. nov. 3]|nr:MAG: hypothetical protein DRQ99_32225 [Gammaproteobacteria bacterium]RKZ74683.1 MAG: hypothetical protein DRR16_31930 [Gammaproteobacteria bacterium]